MKFSSSGKRVEISRHHGSIAAPESYEHTSGYFGNFCISVSRAGDDGIEPPFYAPKAYVRPLDESPIIFDFVAL